jgi:hypothetical protein
VVSVLLFMTSIYKLKNEIWQVYSQWRGQSIFSPALKEEIHFTLLGWNHIVKPRFRSRSTSDMYRRLKLLPYAKEVIAKSTTIQNIRARNGKTYYLIQSVEMVEDKGIKSPRQIKVIVIDTASGKKFYSVMGKKIL